MKIPELTKLNYFSQSTGIRAPIGGEGRRGRGSEIGREQIKINYIVIKFIKPTI